MRSGRTFILPDFKTIFKIQSIHANIHRLLSNWISRCNFKIDYNFIKSMCYDWKLLISYRMQGVEAKVLGKVCSSPMPRYWLSSRKIVSPFQAICQIGTFGLSQRTHPTYTFRRGALHLPKTGFSTGFSSLSGSWSMIWIFTAWLPPVVRFPAHYATYSIPISVRSLYNTS